MLHKFQTCQGALIDQTTRRVLVKISISSNKEAALCKEGQNLKIIFLMLLANLKCKKYQIK